MLTIPEAAREIGMSRAVLWRHVKHGRLPSIGTDKVRLIDADELEKFRRQERKRGRPRKPRPPSPSDG